MRAFWRKQTPYEKISAQGDNERYETYDMFASAQVERAEPGKPISMTKAKIGSIFIGSILFLICWLSYSILHTVYTLAIVSHFKRKPGYLEISDTFFMIDIYKFGIAFLVALGVGSLAYLKLKRHTEAQNQLNDTSDLNQYKSDARITFPEELPTRFDIFPDVGAHSAVAPSSLISHANLSKKGLKKVTMFKRAKKDILDDTGNVVYYAGEVLTGDDGAPLTEEVSIIDEALGDAIWDASYVPESKKIRKRLVAKDLPYNPGNKNRDKLSNYDTVADLINNEWDMVDYEPTRPAGLYYVDTSPANTMLIAITRAGKGQTYIEPMLDMWTRQKRPDNIFANDPKGELLVKFYVRATIRGYQVVQINLMNPEKTDIFNPLGNAAEMARAGDEKKCAAYVDAIANVFFPVEGSDDPVWPNAANNAFKRAAYGLIDYYMDKERELRATESAKGTAPIVIESLVDNLWGKVTLYNCYQLFVTMTSKKMKEPLAELEARRKNGEFDETDSVSMSLYNREKAKAESISFLWDNEPEQDMLSLYFNAVKALPTNMIRKLVTNADNALRAIGGAQKMLASIYGIAITAMSFFTDPTISTLTSGTPSQNVDLGGLAFPRRMGIRFTLDYLALNNYMGAQTVWSAYEDERFTKKLDKLFNHTDRITKDGWTYYVFDGIFENDTSYIKLELQNPENGFLLNTMYFRFTKGHATSLGGDRYILNPITHKKIVRHGVLEELKPEQISKDGKLMTMYKPAKTVYSGDRLFIDSDYKPIKRNVSIPAIQMNTVKYSEQPKMVFVVTPPHLMKYAKLVLIFIKQLVDESFDKSYTTKEDQKPLYKTNYMLDEVGNLQSDGNGIAGLATYLSIGLGQGQQFTLVIQTLQQLKDVYGDSVDKILQGNTANLVYLKSNDGSVLSTLEELSGKLHKVMPTSRTVTRDAAAMLKFTALEAKSSVTQSVEERPVIQFTDLAYLPMRQSIVFIAGAFPIWNRGEYTMPMSWRLYKDTIVNPGHEYSFLTIPSTSTASGFDVSQNQPDFRKMYKERMSQAAKAEQAEQIYREVTGLSDFEFDKMNADVRSDEIMSLIGNLNYLDEQELLDEQEALAEQPDMADMVDIMATCVPESDAMDSVLFGGMEDNIDQLSINAQMQAKREQDNVRIYAGKTISRLDLYDNGATHSLDSVIIDVYKAVIQDFALDKEHFDFDENGNLLGKNSMSTSEDYNSVLIIRDSDNNLLDRLNDSQVARPVDDADGELPSELAVSYRVTDTMYQVLSEQPNWSNLANGSFEREMAERMKN